MKINSFELLSQSFKVCFLLIILTFSSSRVPCSSQNEQATRFPHLLCLPHNAYSFAGNSYAKHSEWLGLYCVGGKSELRKIVLSARPTKVLSYGEGKIAGQILSVKGAAPLCLLRGLPVSRSGRVKTYYPCKRGKHSRLTFPSQNRIELKADGKYPYRIISQKKGDWITYSLYHGGKKQVLSKLEIDAVVGETGLTKKNEILVWAGDLDNDGRADFITSFNSRNGEALTLQLYLSRQAGKKEIVKKVADFYYWPPDDPGC